MKHVTFKTLVLSGVLLTLAACQSEETIVWAEEVQSKTEVYQQEYYDSTYWASINKNVNYEHIFKTVVDEVLAGKRDAYSILTEEKMQLDEVKEQLGLTEGATPITAKDLSAIRMRESWNFNEKEFTLEKKVTRIDFLLTKFDPETRQYLGDGALFYVYTGR
jgi:primosomal protein N'